MTEDGCHIPAGNKAVYIHHNATGRNKLPTSVIRLPAGEQSEPFIPLSQTATGKNGDIPVRRQNAAH